MGHTDIKYYCSRHWFPKVNQCSGLEATENIMLATQDFGK